MSAETYSLGEVRQRNVPIQLASSVHVADERADGWDVVPL